MAFVLIAIMRMLMGMLSQDSSLTHGTGDLLNIKGYKVVLGALCDTNGTILTNLGEPMSPGLSSCGVCREVTVCLYSGIIPQEWARSAFQHF